MSNVQILRALWIPGLQDISGQLTDGLAAWVGERNYSITHVLTKTHFSLDITAPTTLIMAYAFDTGRMAGAAFETMASTKKVDKLPRSLGWYIIQTYYAAFFAGHAIARIFGTSCTQFGGLHMKAISATATHFGITGAPPTAGNYTCVYESSANQMKCTLNSAIGGVHVAFWIAFGKLLDELSQKVLMIPSGLTVDKQAISTKLTELRDIVAQGWLSELRNEVNYKHLFGCWYPYKSAKKSENRLFELRNDWKNDPMTIYLSVGVADLQNFHNTCMFIVALCRVLTEELIGRSRGKCFLEFQTSQILRLT